jgi:hypothetical protein
VLTIPHLKGRGKYFTEAQRTFKKTFTSSIVQGTEYNSNLDIVLFICTLAFRRGIAEYEDFEQWYSSAQSKLMLREDCLNLPVFINSGL